MLKVDIFTPQHINRATCVYMKPAHPRHTCDFIKSPPTFDLI